MNPKQAAPPSTGITPDDVYYILFRHKWLIAALLAVTVTAAILVHALWPVPYTSEARLMIKYVHENKPPERMGPDSQSGSGDARGETVINSEIELITSMDLANTVASNVGPTRIMAKAGGGTNSIAAATVIRMGLVAMTSKSDVIQLTFTHPDQDMVQLILSQLIDAYLKKHHEVHQPEFHDYLQTQRDNAKSQIDDIDKQLQSLKASAGITDSESERTSSELLSKILSEKFEAEAEYAGYTETIKQMMALMPASSTNPAAVMAAPTNAVVEAPPAKVVADYKRICQQFDNLQKDGERLALTYAPGNSLVLTNQAMVARAAVFKKQLEDKYPGLIAMKPADPKEPTHEATPAFDAKVALQSEIFKAKALEARIETLTNQLTMVQNKIGVMGSVEGKISQLQREKVMAEDNFSFYSRRLEETRVEEAVGPGNSNISELESPTPPMRDMSKFNKMILGILLGGLAFTFILPFVVELYLDRSLKRPMDVQVRLGLPFFISIPQLNGNGKARALKNAKRLALLPGKTAAAPAPPSDPAAAPPPGEPQAVPPVNGHLALWDESHSLQPFYETLRDRLMTYFEMINLTHKPKLVAVTSCASGAGVTSTAAGLASSLSETGDGNVLLVNMNVRDGEAHRFYKGKLTCGLDEVLEKGTRGNACVQGNLYVAKEQPEDDRLPRVLPKRFGHLLPKMKASDFDYIIFDMPPVSQISITPRLARFMDMVLLVIESGKTDRDAAKRVAAMLSESKTNVGIVLNKNRSYVPRRLQQEI